MDNAIKTVAVWTEGYTDGYRGLHDSFVSAVYRASTEYRSTYVEGYSRGYADYLSDKRRSAVSTDPNDCSYTIVAATRSL